MYLSVPALRAEIEAPVLLLTATVTQDMVTEITKLLRLDTSPRPLKIIAHLPDRYLLLLKHLKGDRWQRSGRRLYVWTIFD